MGLTNTAWSLKEILEGDAVFPVLAGTQVTAVFSADTVNGNGGCNQYFAAAKYADGDTGAISISDLGSTRMFCSDPPGKMEQESRYFEFLVRSSQFSTDGKSLTLTGPESPTQRILVFESVGYEAV